MLLFDILVWIYNALAWVFGLFFKLLFPGIEIDYRFFNIWTVGLLIAVIVSFVVISQRNSDHKAKVRQAKVKSQYHLKNPAEKLLFKAKHAFD
eukprot:TRINITY_DN78882_c0_g1_i1.p1 TRINITY_DN78882_c0_g1~~TRINITY_DN78882_c0_g1_i1.p1  ORF type:complete len:93 (+),score=5.35 TRINITY_DN78882_c0_g1_i1:37-315(+)